MSGIALIFRRFVSQLVYMIALPVFFLFFLLVYRPLGVEELFENEWFGVHVTMLFSILLVSISIMRLVFFFLQLRLTYTLYACWCLLEMIFASFFCALYIWLVLGRSLPYFDAFTIAFKLVSMSLVFPYVIVSLAVRLYQYSVLSGSEDDDSSRRMRFYDEKHNLKIVLQSDSVLYIKAEVNYVNIVYRDSAKMRSYVLRNSMKAIEELCHEHGLLRCQRSYYVNPRHVKALLKEKEGVIYAEINAPETIKIPVTKRYYDRLSDILL